MNKNPPSSPLTRYSLRRSLLLLCPLLLYISLACTALIVEYQYNQSVKESYLSNQPFAKYLYESYEVQELISERGEVENYYYYLVKINEPNQPYVLLRYRKSESNQIEAELRNLPRTMKGRIDYFYTEDWEYIKRYFLWPGLEAGLPKSIQDSFYYTFNVSTFSYDYKIRNLLLLWIGLLLATLPLWDWFIQRHNRPLTKVS